MLTPLSNAPFLIDMGKKIETKEEIKLYGVRIIIGCFDKHNPQDIYLDGTININGNTATFEALESVKDELHDCLYEWVKSQGDYDKRKYIKKVESPDTFRNKGKRTKLKFDLSLLLKQPRCWSETVEIARGHVMDLYKRIVDVVLLNGLELLPFDGYNSKEYKGL